jgi:catechol 2,3-dioxygenase
MDMSDTRTDSILARAPHRIGKVTLAVRDLSTVSRFYRDVIGLAVIETNPDAVRLGTANSVLLELRHEPGARARSPREAGLFHTAFLLPSRADLGAWTAHAAERRFPLHGAADHRVSEALYLSDPEGNGIEIYADRPRDAWQWNGPSIEMATQRLDIDGLTAAIPAGDPGWRGAPENSVVGHVHLRVGDPVAAEAWWHDEFGFDTVARYGADAVFLSSGGYHHHIGANRWQSAGAAMRDPSRAGLSWVEMRSADAAAGKSVQDPWGTVVRVVPDKR